MDQKHFQSVKRLFGEICKSKPMNQVTRYKQVQVSAKIMLEQKADRCFKPNSQLKNIFLRKHLYSIKDIIARISQQIFGHERNF